MLTKLEQTLAELKKLGSEENRLGMARFGINTERAFGISVAALRGLAKEIGRDHELALALWNSGFHEARILACLVDDPAMVAEAQMEAWVGDFNSWDLCDNCCGSLFDRTPYAYDKAKEWSQREAEFERRAGFALMAWLAVHDKKAENAAFETFFPYLAQASEDQRNFVKKAVNWALRQIGKRNLSLHAQALQLAEEISRKDSKSARWIATDALRELNLPKVMERLKSKDAK